MKYIDLLIEFLNKLFNFKKKIKETVNTENEVDSLKAYIRQKDKVKQIQKEALEASATEVKKENQTISF